MFAGLMLIFGGVMIGTASRAPWAKLPVAGDETVTLSLGVKSSGALVVLATFLVAVGVLRIVRGYREDAFIQTFGTIFVLLAVGLGVAMVALFLRDHNLGMTAISSYELLRPQPGLYVAGAGAGLALLSRLA